MKRLIAVLVGALCLSACNTDGFGELSTVYVENHYPNSGVVPNQGGINPVDPPQTSVCGSLTRKTCQQIKDSYPSAQPPFNSGSMPCVEAQQQHACFKDKDGDNDGIICDLEFDNACPAPITTN